jgi:peptide/nickel transport system permease protein
VTAYLLRRLSFSLLVLAGVSVLVFALIRFLPGDPAAFMLSDASAKPEDIERLRSSLGLDKPFLQQYVTWVAGVFRGDMGTSIYTGRPALQEILQRLPVTLELAVLTLLLALAIAIPAGIISAAWHDTWVDWAARLLAMLGLSVPGFWIGTVMIVGSAIAFNYVPPIGYTPISRDLWRNFQQFIFPSVALGAFLAGSIARLTRSEMLEVLDHDYIRTARAKGFSGVQVLVRHALKNALIPVATLMGVQFGNLLGGTVVKEQIFTLPGIGGLTLAAVVQRDYPQLQANILFLAAAYLLLNLLVDVTYGWLDPRIRYA